MKITTSLTSLFLSFASFTAINSQTAADTINSCQAQNANNVIRFLFLPPPHPHSLHHLTSSIIQTLFLPNYHISNETPNIIQKLTIPKFIFASYSGDLAATYAYSLCFPFEIFGNTLNSALFCRDAHCSFYSDDDCTIPSAFSITPIPFIQNQGLPTKLTSSLGWKSARCGSSLVGFTLGQ
ncbi:uncharacterized protein Bfra_010007 [Botrytis fragariae]|uniref:Uncharacterized protein n=1 Tax=Botrytis fragariae TaxID=1964551 RepID=A0A8H6EFV6_9HELO|nr:uncharacterized protein Bfra_010007 [Botrytis fragariae]KAF5870618.1 hypothetical protein Bfra_010007 [Botrytis fragariae]